VLIQRIVTGTILVAIVVGSILYLPGVWAGCVLGVLWLLGAREWAGFARSGLRATVLFVVAVAVLMWAASMMAGHDAVVLGTITASMIWWAIALVTIATYPHRISVPVVILAGFCTLLPPWLLFSYLHGLQPLGRLLLLTVFVIVWSADIGAFLVGRLIGRIKLAPKVSPGKTWEGVIGGVLFAAMAGLVMGYILDSSSLQWVALAMATAVASVVGDLAVSMFKRNVGLKDSGAILPGHGGVLDRVDSLTSAVVVFVLGLMITGVIG